MLFTSLEVASLEDARRPILATQLLKLPGDGPGNPRPVHPDDQRLHGPVLLGTRDQLHHQKGKISGRLLAGCGRPEIAHMQRAHLESTLEELVNTAITSVGLRA